ncbi:MAG: hypothetical protein AAF641_11190 [Pseudomonadota bacterium]
MTRRNPGVLKIAVFVLIAALFFPIAFSLSSNVISADFDRNARADDTTFLMKINALFGRENKIKRPIDFVPEAPEGWFRVTIFEARDPDTLSQLKEKWPQIGPSDTFPVEESHCFDTLTDMIGSVGKTRPLAVYLNPNRECIWIWIQFRGVLGPKDDPEMWREAVLETARRDLRSGQYIQQVQLGDILVVNRGNRACLDLPCKPIKLGQDETLFFRIWAALTNRSVVELRGVAKQSVVEDMLLSIDREALWDKFD